MADVFGEAKRQREGQKPKRIWFVSGQNNNFARATRFFIQFSGMLLKR